MKKLSEFKNFLKKYTDVITRVEYKESEGRVFVILEVPSVFKGYGFIDCINHLRKDYNANLCLSSTKDNLRYSLFLEY